ncbi:Carboxypeptidase regulatory-like domain-containing protein [Bryocella elongata]|uniref:Carboxypeptidase regulatory-like domain-containing protein n=1 Tax=Bryocella elongata TaxID=863522 RepID=A0A1H5WM73_9BACT|nr:TonB-dependent receptor [Bryocella elongata]SEG00574.1 Carboxypeptidase regulatory-like domain-containing protein [Bryocella elongata]
MRKLLQVAAAVVLLAMAGRGTPAAAQNTNSGDIRGVVSDSSGAVVQGASVTVLDTEKGVTKVYTTNQDGLFDTGPIVTGNYRITVQKDGFSSFVRSSVTLEVGTITINASLKPGAVTEQVVVTTDVPLIQTETGEQSTTLVANEMQKRPNVGQDWENFVKFIPGSSSAASYSGATGQAISVNGNLPYNAVLADGASSALSHSGNADVSVFETVQEVQVSTSAFSAQYGIGGVVFNQITKGGSNSWHGSLYEYAQNDALNSKSYFQTSKPYLRFHNFGGSVSGPALKDKLFFYFDYDQTISKSASTGYATVPTQAMRNGDFSALAPIYQPGTGAYVTYNGKTYINRTQYANNNIAAHIDPSAAKLQALIPLPNYNGPQTTVNSGSGITTNNYYYSIRGTNPFKKYFGRLDYDVTPHNRITASVTQHDNPAFYPNAFPCPVNCYVGDVDGYNSQITDVWNISDHTINEARLGYTNQLNFFTPQTEGSGVGGKFGVGFLAADILPTINISSYTGLAPGTAAVYKEHNYDPSDVVTMIRGKHVLKFGGEYLIFQDNSTAWGNINGATYGFTGTYTSCSYCQQAVGGGQTSTGNGYADFLLGTVQNWSAGVTPEFAGRQKAPQMFVQDDWKVKPNLTINLGLRYQIMEGWSDNKKNQSTFDPLVQNSLTGTPGAIWFAVNKDHGRTQLQDNVYTTFLPRVGFAWQFRPGTVIRGGYGLYAYLWSLDTYGSGEGAAFGGKGSLSDSTSGLTPIGQLATTTNYPYVTASTSNSAFNGQNVSINAENTPTARIHQYNLSVQRQIGANMSAQIAYVGSRSVNLGFNVDNNQVPASKLIAAATNTNAQRPYTQYGTIGGNIFDAGANYNSLQLEMNRRLSRNIAFQASYVWSKFLDEFDSSAWGSRGGTTTYQSAYDVSSNYGPSNFDARHAFKGTASYVLPFGKGQMFLNHNAFLDEAVGGWQLSANFSLQTGNPFTVTVPGSLSATYAGSGNQYPSYAGNANLPKGQRTLAHWYNTSYQRNSTNGGQTVLFAGDTAPAFIIPEYATFGNVHRDSVYGPGYEYFDLSMGKSFNLYKERYKFQLRIDANNVLNHPTFALPGTGLNTGNVGSGNTGTAGKITGTIGSGRVIQLGGRFSF